MDRTVKELEAKIKKLERELEARKRVEALREELEKWRKEVDEEPPCPDVPYDWVKYYPWNHPVKYGGTIVRYDTVVSPRNEEFITYYGTDDSNS